VKQKIILLELNEVPWRVLDRYKDLRPRSAVRRVLDEGAHFTTRTPDQQLSPWTTWSTVHRGVPDTKHGIVDFGQELDDVNSRYHTLWRLAAAAGLKVGNVGSLHSYPLPEYLDSCAFWIPDVFAPSHECKPAEAQSFQEINLRMSRESGRNVSRRIPTELATRFLINARKLGITVRTAASVATQLASEVVNPRIKMRRRTFQSILAFDIFQRQLEHTQPDFCSFFTNHVASAMHRYWAATFPDDYERNKYDEPWRAAFRGEIDWAMSAFDRMLDKLLGFIDRNPHYSLWIASSMGQAAVESNQIKRQVLLADVPQFMSALGFGAHEWERRPAMEPRVIVKLPEKRAPDFERLAQSIRIVGRHPITCVNLTRGVFRLHPGTVTDADEDFCELDGRRVPFSALGFANVAIEDEAGQSAYHVREGTLIVYSPSRTHPPAARSHVSTLEIAPAILRSLGVEPPSYMVDTQITA
jgi:hypothetical protein